MKAFIRSKKGTSKVLGTLVMIIVVFISGFFFYNFVTSNVNFSKNTFNTQMTNLLLNSFSANSTHIVAFIKNSANKAIEFTQAYTNNMLAVLQGGKAIIESLSTGVAIIRGSFMEGSTYTVKLANIFNVAITFDVTV